LIVLDRRGTSWCTSHLIFLSSVFLNLMRWWLKCLYLSPRIYHGVLAKRWDIMETSQLLNPWLGVFMPLGLLINSSWCDFWFLLVVFLIELCSYILFIFSFVIWGRSEWTILGNYRLFNCIDNVVILKCIFLCYDHIRYLLWI